MEKHITVVGVIRIGFAVLGIMAALIVLAATIGPGVLILTLEGDQLPLTILSVVGTIIAAFLVVLAIPGIIGGIGLLRHRPWARYLVLIMAVLDLFNIPIGTLVGAYSIWVLMQDRTMELFESGSSD